MTYHPHNIKTEGAKPVRSSEYPQTIFQTKPHTHDMTPMQGLMILGAFFIGYIGVFFAFGYFGH